MTEYNPALFQRISSRRFKEPCGEPDPLEDLLYTPPVLFFGYLDPGGVSQPQPFIISNTGEIPIGIEEISVPPPFFIVDGTPAIILPGQSLEFLIRFEPQDEGLATAEIKILVGVATDPIPTVHLVGVGGAGGAFGAATIALQGLIASVGNLEEIYGEVEPANAAKLAALAAKAAAELAASQAQTHAESASGHAETGAGWALVSGSHADDANNWAVAAQASAVTATAAYDYIVQTEGNQLFREGTDAWTDTTANALARQPMPADQWDFVSEYNEAPDVLVPTDAGIRQLTGFKRYYVLSDRSFRIRSRIYVTAGSGDVTNSIGIVCVDPSGVILSTRYPVADAVVVAAGAGWLEYERVIEGFGPGDNQFSPGTASVLLTATLNQGNNTTTRVAIDYFTYEDTTVADRAASHATAAATSASVAATQAGNASASAEAAHTAETNAAASAGEASASAATATSQASSASESAAQATTYAGLSATFSNGGMARNPSFAIYPNPATPAYLWGDGQVGLVTRVEGKLSPYAMRLTSTAGGSCYTSQIIGSTTDKRVRDLQWCVIEAEVELTSGTFAGAGVLFRVINSLGNAQQDIKLIFSTDRDNADEVPGAGAVGRIYKFSKLVQINLVNAAYCQLYAMAHWSSLGSVASANAITFERLNVRPATQLEIETRKATTDLVSAWAAISNEQTARASADGALAGRASALEATVNHGSTGVAAAHSRISSEETARANGDSANATSISNLTSTVNGHTSSLNTHSSAISGLNGRTEAFWQVTAVAGGRAQIRVWADDVSGGGVDIVGDMRIDGDLLVNGTIIGSKIGNGAVSTPKIEDNSVTFVDQVSNGSTINGNGAYQTLVSFNVNMAYPGNIILIGIVGQSFSGSSWSWGASLSIGGTIVNGPLTGNVINSSLAIAGQKAVAAGNHTVSIDWLGSSNMWVNAIGASIVAIRRYK